MPCPVNHFANQYISIGPHLLSKHMYGVSYFVEWHFRYKVVLGVRHSICTLYATSIDPDNEAPTADRSKACVQYLVHGSGRASAKFDPNGETTHRKYSTLGARMP